MEDASDPAAFESLAEMMEDLLEDVDSYLQGNKSNSEVR